MKFLQSKELAALLALVLIGVTIRAQHLASPFYYDVAVCVNLAQHPFHSDFYPDRIFFQHPPAKGAAAGIFALRFVYVLSVFSYSVSAL